MKLFTLGGVRIRLDGEAFTGLATRKVEALLIYLARSGRPVPRDVLAELLWGGRPQTQAMSSLRVALTNLRKHLGAHFHITRHTAGVNPEAEIWIDATDMEARLGGLRGSGSIRSALEAEEVAEGVALYEGDFLEGFHLRRAQSFEEWATVERQRLWQLALDGLFALTGFHLTQGTYEAGIPFGRRLLELDPLTERGHQQMMRLLAYSGQRTAALAQYEACHLALMDELGVEPGAETQALYEEIRSGELRSQAEERSKEGEHGESAHLTERAGVRHNLPPQPTPFVGREAELAALEKLVVHDRSRLVTIVGPGGIGKTRLALTFAERLVEGDSQVLAHDAGQSTPFPDGVFFVSLDDIDTPELMLPAIAKALNLSLEHGEPQLLDYLRPTRLLLIMDNLEQAVDGIDLVARILQSATEVQIVATSRERLQLLGEQVYPIHGLDLPPEGKTADILDYTAGQLFIQSARRRRPTFVVASDDLDNLADICRLVEGMPLALELAAAWTDVLPLAEIGTEIRQTLDFLATDLRNVPARHRSMVAVLESSWQRLKPDEQALFAELSVFVGGFTREAAQAVTGASLRNLARLVDKSFLSFDQVATRYAIHGLLRQYGAERLGKSDVFDRHSEYFCQWLHRLEPALYSTREDGILADVDKDSRNVRIAWQRAVSQRNESLLLKAITCLCKYLHNYLHPEGEAVCQEILEWLQPVKRLSVDQQRLLAITVSWWATFRQRLSQPRAETYQLLRRTIALIDDLDPAERDQILLEAKSHALLQLGYVSSPEESWQWHERSLASFRKAEDAFGEAAILQAIGLVAIRSGDWGKAEAFLSKSLRLCRQIRAPLQTSAVLGHLADVYFSAGKFAMVAQLVETFLVELKHLQLDGNARVLLRLASLLTNLGRFSESIALVDSALKLLEAPGSNGNRHILMMHSFQGLNQLHQGNYKEAQREVQISLRLSQEIRDPFISTYPLRYMACLALVEGAYDQVERLAVESVSEFHPSFDRPRAKAISLALVAYSRCKIGQFGNARQRLVQAVRTALKTREFYPLLYILPGISLLLAEEGRAIRAIEVYALACSQPLVANSRWFEDVVGQHVKHAADSLSPDEIEVARARGQSFDLWETAAALLEELAKR